MNIRRRKLTNANFCKRKHQLCNKDEFKHIPCCLGKSTNLIARYLVNFWGKTIVQYESMLNTVGTYMALTWRAVSASGMTSAMTR